jgi:hypothetical protein
MIAWIRVITGAALLLLGRRLFWLSVGLLGFAVGALVATQLVDASPIVVFGAALAGGLIGVLLALFLQSLAILLAGFVAGGLFLMNALAVLGLSPEGWRWLPFIIGGIVGAVLMSLVFDWALIVLTSLAGAGLIVPVLDLAPTTSGLLYLGLALVGVVIQAATRGRPTGSSGGSEII